MAAADTLLVLPALTARLGADGLFVLTQKFIDGVLQYVDRWPGPVRVAIERDDRPGSNLDEVQVHPQRLPFQLQWRPAGDEFDAVIAESGVVLASLVDKNVSLADRSARVYTPLVYISEYSVRTRRQIIRTETANPILRWRRERWTVGLERRYEHSVRAAAGVQCNGTPTHDAYRSLSPRVLLYFDTRVRTEQLTVIDELSSRFQHLQSGKPLRLAFSGRLIAMKGADHLVRVAAELSRLGVPFTLDICGGGTLEPAMRMQIAANGLAEQVRLRGVLDFQKELMPFIRDDVDLFICCHRQGDPSCTYLETMSCGTPILGYDNEAFAGLARQSGTGFVTELDRPEHMARRIAALNTDRSALMRAAEASLAFAARHTFERTMQARVDHLLACTATRSAGVSA